jgi:phosphoribosylamine--glycine ligase
MEEKLFGSAGARVVIEEFLVGEEASYLVVTDGQAVVPLASAQDHKAVFDDDKGPNTGGMGAYSPAPIVTKELEKTVLDTIMKPVVKAMEAEGRPYKGVLYAGLMVTARGPKVLEFNARLGDPETQPILMRLKSDLMTPIMAVVDSNLSGVTLDWEKGSAVCVVMCAKGYPGDCEKDKLISGIEEAEKDVAVKVFHAGTRANDGRLVTSGGRVLGVTALGKDVKEAVEKAYLAVGRIKFDNAHYRKDIGAKALGRA